ncbi:MAG: cysteine--tRNA ligase [Nanoarchaeota archaeon]|nr:cysteine--tRNA ligase [Nanoarchaeota archaeon]
MKLYNTRTRKKQVFKPIDKDKVRMYCCGPTVYDYAHIGNFRTFLFEDFLRRALKRNGYELIHVMNITDVGHLTSDADEGEDKLMKALKREGKKPSVKAMLELAEYYTKAFFKDSSLLNIEKPEAVPKATEHIEEMVELNKKIEKNGYAYKTSVGLIFDTGKFKDYAKFGKLNLKAQKAGARVKVDEERKKPWDFALWITNQPSHIMQWQSPWGKGFPGWHLECSAMSIKYLGEQFDIHCGGEDHIKVHHTNEIAQSEAATGKKPWVRFWLHGAFLIMQKDKMSKSAGSFVKIQDLVDKGFDPLAYRYLCLTANYRSKLSFSWKVLENAQKSLNSFRSKIKHLNELNELDKNNKRKYAKKFDERVNNDLDLPSALALAWSVVKAKDLGSKEKVELLLDFDQIFGLKLAESLKKDEAPKKVLKLIKEREEARKKKDWVAADALRDKIKSLGWKVQDSREGPKLEKV